MDWIKWLGSYFEFHHQGSEISGDVVPETFQLHELSLVEDLKDDILSDYVVILTPSDRDVRSNTNVESSYEKINPVDLKLDTSKHDSVNVLKPRESIANISEVLKPHESSTAVRKPKEPYPDIPQPEILGAEVHGPQNADAIIHEEQKWDAEVSKFPRSNTRVPELQKLCTNVFRPRVFRPLNLKPDSNSVVNETHECESFEAYELLQKYKKSLELCLKVLEDERKEALLPPASGFTDISERQLIAKVLELQKLNSFKFLKSDGFTFRKSDLVTKLRFSEIEKLYTEASEPEESSDIISKTKDESQETVFTISEYSKWSDMLERRKKFHESCRDMFGPISDGSFASSNLQSENKLLDCFLANFIPPEDTTELNDINSEKYLLTPALESAHFLETLKNRKAQCSDIEECLHENANIPQAQSTSRGIYEPQHLNGLRRSYRIYNGLSVLENF